MKTKITLLIAFICISCYAQSAKKNLQNGTLLLKNNETITFIDLRYEGDKVYYTNTRTQQQEHLFLDSIVKIYEGDETVDLAELDNSPQEPTKPLSHASTAHVAHNQLKDGAYKSFEDLVNANPLQSETYQLKQREGGNYKNYYFLLNSNNQKEKELFAYVENGELYVRASDAKTYFTEKKSQQFSGGRKIYVKMQQAENNQYIAALPFSNTTLSLIGGLASGVIGGVVAPGIGSAAAIAGGGAGLFSLVAVSKQKLVIDLSSHKIYLEKNMN